ncbi:MAG TPA: CapA family protein [Acidiferrobacterales bacterium]
MIPTLTSNRAPWLLGVLPILLAACVSAPRPAGPPTPAQAEAPAEVVRETPAPARELLLSAVGDIMLDGSARALMVEHGYDYPFVHMRELFRDSQIVLGNLEGPLTGRGSADPGKQYSFRSPPDAVAPALKRAGFNVVSLANNHTLDYGVDGLADTMAALDAAGIAHAGAGMNLAAARRPAVLTIDGTRVAVLAYSLTLPESFFAGRERPGTAYGHEQQVRADVAAARAQADIVIVSFHWGQEGKTTLREYQPRLGRAAIDAGAQAVIGHHPHILQGVERYKDGVILYSLGNFAFGSYSPRSRDSVVAQLRFVDHRFHELTLVPINVHNFEVNFQPQVLPRDRADRVVAHLQELSAPHGTVLVNRDGVAQLTPIAAAAAGR